MDVKTLTNNPQTLKDVILQINLEHQRQLDIQRQEFQAQLAEANQHKAAAEAELLQANQQKQQLADTLQKQQDQINDLQRLVDYFRRKMYGPRSEKIDANQLLLFGEQVLPLTTPAEEKLPVEVKVNRPRRPHGRRIIPADLPRVEVRIEVPADERSCGDCGREKRKIGEVITEQLELIPAKLFVRRFVQEKLACGNGCDASVITAPKPVQPIEKCLAGPGLIAHVVTCKYVDHLPLYRLEGMFARYGIEISRSTMCDWIGGVAKLAVPLVKLMRRRILSGRVIHSDDTTVPVQDVGKTKTGRLWVYLGDQANPYCVFDYSPDRRKEHPQVWLEEYGGYLQVDAYGGYDGLFAGGKIIEVACWAHARRKFYEARDSSPSVCNQALSRIGKLYELEREVKEMPEQQRLELRQSRAVGLLEEMEVWLKQMKVKLLPQSPAAQAIVYCQNQWEALKRYTQSGYLSIDNNVAERELRPVALGRKNWLFAGSDEGGRTAATLYSLARSAIRHELNVENYLRSVLAHLPGTKLSELHHLLPDEWKQNLAAEISSSAINH